MDRKNSPDDWQKLLYLYEKNIYGQQKRMWNIPRYLAIKPWKIYTKILEQCVSHIVDPHLSPSHFRFKKWSNCTDALFNIRQMSEGAIEYNKELNILFVYQEKTFDGMDRNIDLKMLANYGIKEQLFHNIKALYQNATAWLDEQTDLTHL